MSTKKTTKAQKTEKTPKAKKPAKTDGKLSCLDAAAKVLGESKEPMNTKEIIDAMAAKGYRQVLLSRLYSATTQNDNTPHFKSGTCCRKPIIRSDDEERLARRLLSHDPVIAIAEALSARAAN